MIKSLQRQYRFSQFRFDEERCYLQREGVPLPARMHAPDSPEFGLIDGTLPGAAGKLIGRERELAALQAHMPRHRLVMVTGFGGMGNTRLAIEFAREHAADPLNKTIFLGLDELRQNDPTAFRLAG